MKEKIHLPGAKIRSSLCGLFVPDEWDTSKKNPGIFCLALQSDDTPADCKKCLAKARAKQ
jgi:hypothetical protein